MRALGRMMAGGRGRGQAGAVKRPDGDFYPTPPSGTAALMIAEEAALRARAGEVVCEPACGDGAMARIIERCGFRVVASDLVDRGYGRGGVDFLKLRDAPARAIVTNPPFRDDRAEAFVAHALGLRVQYVAVLLKATFFHAKARRALYATRPPSAVYPLAFRLDFFGLGRPTMECSWFVWRTPFRRPGEPADYMTPLEDPGRRRARAA